MCPQLLIVKAEGIKPQVLPLLFLCTALQHQLEKGLNIPPKHQLRPRNNTECCPVLQAYTLHRSFPIPIPTFLIQPNKKASYPFLKPVKSSQAQAGVGKGRKSV